VNVESLRVRAWLGLVTTVVVALVFVNVRSLPQIAFPAPGDLPATHGATALTVTLDGDVATLHIGAADGVLYGMSFSIDERVGGRWVNRFVAGLVGPDDEVVEPFRPRDDMFWPAAAGFGARDVRVSIDNFDTGTYRMRKYFFRGLHPNLEEFELAAVFTLSEQATF
jgi:hypothetical protein